MSDAQSLSLDQLIALAVDDPSLEDVLFARLLGRTLYVHSPEARRGPTLSLVQFTTPQGVLAIPVFTDRRKSEFASGGNVQTVPIQGRQLLHATQGATIVVNPNDNWCILYPEEIQLLLQGKPLGRTPESMELSNPPDLRPPQSEPSFVHAVVASLSSSDLALNAWLTETDATELGAPVRYVIVVAAAKPHHERIARMLTLGLSDTFRSLDNIVDITFIEPGKNHATWLKIKADCLIFSRPRSLDSPYVPHGNT
ncbi:SseB family protein [Arenimonas donghaensis]|uniref:SseB family protein n=1 Tax=Arenimonas donghaensis TaxID=375061 RepID=UPI001361F6FC|nr:SseB family protein [Arenimonas donghaensis]